MHVLLLKMKYVINNVRKYFFFQLWLGWKLKYNVSQIIMTFKEQLIAFHFMAGDSLFLCFEIFYQIALKGNKNM